MTTVVALARHGQVWMAADSLTNVYERPVRDGARKIRRVPVGDDGGVCLLAVSGAGGLADLMGFRLRLAAAPESAGLGRWAADAAWAVTELAQAVVLVSESRVDGSLLLGYGGRLWTLSESHAIPAPDGIAALGSGEGPAIGALDALLAHGVGPARAVLGAVRIAIDRDRNSAGPVYVEHLLAPPQSERMTIDLGTDFAS